MKKLFKQFAIFAAVMGVATVVGTDAFATTTGGNLGGGYESGKSLYDDLVGNLTGTTGTTIGLLISLVGLYMWIWNQVSWGIFVAIGGALMTAFPGIYTNLAGGAKDAFKETVSN
jgi:hypothetical protein